MTKGQKIMKAMESLERIERMKASKEKKGSGIMATSLPRKKNKLQNTNNPA